MSRKATESKSAPASSRRARKPATPSNAFADSSQMLGLSIGDLSRTTLFDPVPMEDELPPKRLPRSRRPTQCTVGCHYTDVLVDGRWQSARIPTVRLSGRWLAELGFEPGSKPRIAIVDGALVITPVPKART